MRRTLRRLRNLLLGLIGFIILVWLFLAYEITYPGLTPHQSASIMVNDLKFGSRSIPTAKLFGDRFLQAFQEESQDYTEINPRNAFWLTSVLVSLNTDGALKTSETLYNKHEAWPKLVGAAGLAAKGLLDKKQDWKPWAKDVYEHCKSLNPIGESYRHCPGESEAAAEFVIKIAGIMKDQSSLPLITDALESQNPPLQEAACGALASLGDTSAVILIESAFRSPGFYPVDSAFKALIAFGDKAAVGIAISRIDQNPDNFFWQSLRKELEQVTGQRFGFDKSKWQNWWQTAEKIWTVPERFLRTNRNDLNPF
jgi:hypothetical protein